jgi:hypothetical protein
MRKKTLEQTLITGTKLNVVVLLSDTQSPAEIAYAQHILFSESIQCTNELGVWEVFWKIPIYYTSP